MDKLVPIIQPTPLTPQSSPAISSWYTSEVTVGIFTPSEAAWMHARGWKTTGAITEGGLTTYFFVRRVLKPESVLQTLVADYTTAYNEGRTLNDQRYDDLVTLYTSVLDKTENSFNFLEADDTTYEALIEALLANLDTDFTAYDTDVTGDLDAWGVDQLAEANARFDAELSKAQLREIDRGFGASSSWTIISAGIERERTRALLAVNSLISERQLGLKHKVYDEQKDVRGRVMAARERLRGFLHDSKNRQVTIRNAAVAALGRLIEARTDGYPDLSQIGQLAASLGAGSAESYSA